MTKTYKLTTISQVVDAATILSGSWFRGDSRVHGDLMPAIFREEYEQLRNERRDLEFYLIDAFKRGAPTLSENLPDQDDDVAWLFLMQHHGTPTRLLDWSESALIALYFAVSDHLSCNGELWAMYPHALNEFSQIKGIPTLSHPIVRYLASAPTYEDIPKLAANLGLDDHPQHPVAIQPQMISPRMVSQLSAFTLHPRPKKGFRITDLLQDERSLVRYVIPSDSKRKLLTDLASLGITKRILFQDLDSLSVSLKLGAVNIDYTPPDPPSCDGELS